MADDTTPSGAEWIEAFARQIGLEAPDVAAIDTLLELAGVAAHASQRTAAPIACYLVGRAGITPADALAIARSTHP
ncbi:MAG TPA: DUF6457 domain-containing protein [Acidimicrobiales bacterium]|jgi:hypothetical protein|nr:DUF6457 domain-containing protein [Acidimicrobiales bacterium]